MNGLTRWRRGAWLFALSLLLTFGVFVTPQSAAAQCGGICEPCGGGEFDYAGTGAGNYYGWECNPGNSCTVCTLTNASEVGRSDSEILTEIRDALPEDLPKVLAIPFDRLFLHESRNLLAIRGKACRAGQVTTVVFLTPTLTRALSRLGVGRLAQSQ